MSSSRSPKFPILTCSSTLPDIDAEALPPAEFARWFPTPRLELIGDEVIDAEIQDGGFFNTDGVRPLALFEPRASIFRCSA